MYKGKKRGWIVLGVWLSYVWMTTLAGLAIHPYRSMKKIVLSKKGLLPVSLSPILGMIGLLIIGRMGGYVFELSGWWRELVAMILGVGWLSLLMWQMLLLGLMWRFWLVLEWGKSE